MSIVELWDDLLKTDLILPSNIFKSASYLGIPDESRGKIWLHMVDQREKRCGTQHQSDFKVKISFFLRKNAQYLGFSNGCCPGGALKLGTILKTRLKFGKLK